MCDTKRQVTVKRFWTTMANIKFGEGKIKLIYKKILGDPTHPFCGFPNTLPIFVCIKIVFRLKKWTIGEMFFFFFCVYSKHNILWTSLGHNKQTRF